MSARDPRGRARTRSGSRREPAGPAPAAPGTRSRPLPRLAWLAGAALLAGVLVLAWWRFARPPAAPASADPLSGMPIGQAYDTAIRLMNEGHGMRSLPYFQHARRGAADVSATFHYNYAGALFNALFETDTLAGVARPAWRTSEARVAAMRECLAEKLAAVNTATSAKDRAFYANRVGRLLQVWGFQWEAYLWYKQAAELDPTSPEYGALVNGFMDVLTDPVHAPSVTPLDYAGLRR